MLFSASNIALAAQLLYLLNIPLVTASPFVNPDQIFGLEKRQTDTTIGNVAIQDETDEEIAADGTGAMRTPNARSVYLSNQATATFYQIDLAASDADASYTSFVTVTSESPSPVPTAGMDPRQTQGGPGPWNVDHIFELQVVAQAFAPTRARPTTGTTSIDAATWKAVQTAVSKTASAAEALGSALTVFDNLIGIPNGPNNLKRQVFTYNLTGAGNGPSEGNGATYYAFEGVAIRKNLIARQSGVNDVITAVADQLKSAGNSDPAVSKYFVHFGSLHYQGAIDFLETWTGKPVVGPRTASATTSSTIPTTTCSHSSAPKNTCSALADSKGWCRCGGKLAGTSLGVASGTSPCVYTTTPSATYWYCPTPTTTK